MYIIIIKGT